MQNNDVFRRLRYALKINDDEMINIFSLVERNISKSELLSMLKRDDEEGFTVCGNPIFIDFLQGLIIKKRGMKNNTADEPKLIIKLNNNTIFKMIRIALQLKDEDILDILTLADFKISKNEVASFFRKPGQKNYKECGDQILRNFLKGLTIKLRGNTSQ